MDGVGGTAAFRDHRAARSLQTKAHTRLLILLVFAVSFAPTRAEGEERELERNSGARPRECVATAIHTAQRRLWGRAQTPALFLYCDLLGRVTAELAFDPADAYRSASQAHELQPLLAGARALQGRVLLRLGRVTEAVTTFEEAAARDPSCLDDPFVLADFAAALRRAGQAAKALPLDRITLARLSSSPSAARALVLREGTLAALALGPAYLMEAIGFLDAEQELPPHLRWHAAASLRELLLDRARPNPDFTGRHHVQPAMQHDARSDELGAEQEAMNAWTLEGHAPEEARRHWEKYLLASNLPPEWSTHARQRLEYLASPASRSERRASPAWRTGQTPRNRGGVSSADRHIVSP